MRSTITRSYLAAWVGLACFGCDAPEHPVIPAAPPIPTQVIDLSPVVTEDLPVRFWGHRVLSLFGFSDSTAFRHVEGENPFYYQDSYLTLFSHAGPHVDAPSHMERGGAGIDAFPLATFVGPLRVFDLRAGPVTEPIARSEFEGKGIQPGDVVVAFVGYEPPSGREDFPSFRYLSTEAAQYLAGIPVRLFGTDALSVDGATASPGTMGYEANAPVHYAFLTHGIPVIEQLVNLEQALNAKNPIFVGLPLRVAGGNASPIRAAALVY